MSTETAAPPVLQIEGLTAGYDKAAVVRGLDLHVRPGEIVALLGPNGAGKTTTLRAISGIVHPMSGTIRIDGNDIAKVAPAGRAVLGIAHVPEGRGLFFGLTVAEHFRLGHRGERLDADIAYEHFPALAEIKDRRAGLLSGGEQQMLALGRALARKPHLLLLDEMSLGLAPIIVERLLPVVATYARESGCALLLVEQHIEIALAVADRGYVLSHGELVMHGSAEVLGADHQLILSSYLGHVDESASASAPELPYTEVDVGRGLVMANEQANMFPDPLSIPTPAGCEGWEEMYPYYVLFSEDRAEYERSRFWFQNRYHLMDPMKPFDMVTPEFCYIAIANRNNRIFQLPPATGVDFRVVNGYGYLSGNPVLDPEQIGARAVTFGQRAGHYYENWAEIENDWMERTKAEIAKLEALERPDLPELEDLSVVTNHQAHGAGYEMHQFFNRLMEAKHLAWHFHMELILIGFGAYNTFFDFCQQRFPEIGKQTIANMIKGLGGTPFDRADEELKRLAQVAVDLNLDDAFRGGSAEEIFARLADSERGRQWLAEYDKSKYPWFMVNTGDGMYSHHRAWIDDPRMIVTGLQGYITQLRAGKDLSRPQEQRAEGDRVAQGYRDLLESEDDRKAFDATLGLARLVSVHIEGHKFYIEHWWHGLFYNKVRELSQVFVKYGFWEDSEDIFMLHQAEVLEALLDMLLGWAGDWPARGPKYWPPKIARRKEILARLAHWTPPPALGPVPEVVPDPVLSMLWGIDGTTLREWARPVDADTKQLHGTPASSGVVEGLARVVHGVDQMDTVQQGEILVAPTTNPSWTPVFSRISACVADGGGMMSHAAIVCREHGLPAIVGTGRATRAVKTGQRIRVDANAGVVTILD